MSRKGNGKGLPGWAGVLFILTVIIAVVFVAVYAATGKFNTVLFTIVVSAAIIAVVVIGIHLSSPESKGKRGERKVNAPLQSLTDKFGGEYVYDIIVRGNDGKTSQIDHVLVCTKGVFVIETKNYAGRIYGSDAQKEWTQVLAYGNSKKRFLNPVLQNKTHIRRLQEALGEKIPMENIVVFAQGNTQYIDSEYVYTVGGMKKHIASCPDRYSNLDVSFILAKLRKLKENPASTSEQHVAAIRETKKAIQKGICPCCGGQLVLRIPKNGGSRFYGCSNYPKCRYTKPYNK